MRITHKSAIIFTATIWLSIGIFLLYKYRGTGLAGSALKELMKKVSLVKYRANIAPNNKASIKFFEKMNFKLKCHVYEWDYELQKTS